MPNSSENDKVIIGKLGTSYGVYGWIYVHLQSDITKAILKIASWNIKHNSLWKKVNVSETRPHKNAFIAKFEGIDTPEDARSLTNCPIAIPAKDMPKLPSEHYYWHQLIDLSVSTIDGINLGHVKEILETGANDVFVVEKAGSRILIPYIDSAIIKIDTSNKTMIVDWETEET